MSLENLLTLPNAAFEEGHKYLYQKALRGVAKIPVISKMLPSITKALNESSYDLPNNNSIMLPQVEKLIADNLLFLPDNLFLRASPYHIDRWTRDAFYTCLAINDAAFQIHLLSKTLHRNRRYPQAPTTRLFDTDREWYFDDESTAISIIWRAKIAQEGIPVLREERSDWQDRLGWLTKHSEDGSYVTPAGTERSWYDTFIFPEPDVIKYNQGIYTASLIAAERLGLTLPKGELKNATAAYNSLNNSEGRLSFSRNFNYKDASSLTGEFLANRLFNVSLLDPGTTLATIRTLDPVPGGYKVVSDENGQPLNPNQFNQHCLPGDYHNWANWPLFSGIARYTGEKHGLPTDQIFWQELYNILRISRGAEYARTSGDLIELNWNRQRENHAWNALAYTLIAELSG